MNKEICNWCEKPMGNSLNKVDGIPIHSKCKEAFLEEKEKTEGMFTCPLCGKHIDHVNVFSTCRQIGDLKEGTNKIQEYSSVEEVLDTTSIECPECDQEIREYIEE